jgi:hypothetical protein
MGNICIYLAIRMIRDGKSSSLFKLHSRFRLTFTETLQAVTYLKNIGLVDFDGKVFSLKDDVTKKQLTALYKKLRFRKLNLEEKDIDYYKKMAISPAELYLPNLSRLTSSLYIDD